MCYQQIVCEGNWKRWRPLLVGFKHVKTFESKFELTHIMWWIAGPVKNCSAQYGNCELFIAANGAVRNMQCSLQQSYVRPKDNVQKLRCGQQIRFVLEVTSALSPPSCASFSAQYTPPVVNVVIIPSSYASSSSSSFITTFPFVSHRPAHKLPLCPNLLLM